MIVLLLININYIRTNKTCLYFHLLINNRQADRHTLKQRQKQDHLPFDQDGDKNNANSKSMHKTSNNNAI